MNDPLSNRLRDWAPPTPDFDPAFSVRVQARLREDSRAGWTAAFRLSATACVLLSVALGVAGGLRTADKPSTEQLAAAYVRSIDPLQMTAGNHAGHDHP